MIKTITAALLSAAIVATPLVASAQEGGRTTGVTYRDLDLATQEGRAELDRRIDIAARNVCGMDETMLGTRLPTSSQRRCYRDAREQLDQRFAQLVNANGGRS